MSISEGCDRKRCPRTLVTDPPVLWPGGCHHSKSQELPLEPPPSECQKLAVPGTSPPPHVPHTALVPAYQPLQPSHHTQPLGGAHIPGAAMIDTCVPGIGAGGPGQLRGKGAEQIEEGPGEDDDVVYTHSGVLVNSKHCHLQQYEWSLRILCHLK